MIVEVHLFETAKQLIQQIPPEAERDLPIVSLPEGTTTEDLLKLLGVRSDRLRPFVSLNDATSVTTCCHTIEIESVSPMAGGTS
jgi:hypothetical protein